MSERVLLCVSGGIAAYKAPELVRQLVVAGHEVQVLMTRAAAMFVTPMSLATVSRRPVRSELGDIDAEIGAPGRVGVGHIELADWATRVLIAPATANLLARAAHGLADDLVTTVLLATRAPLVFAPAMNTNMWAHPATQANVAVLRARGASFVGPESGELACGYEGAGRMSDPAAIVEALRQFSEREDAPSTGPEQAAVHRRREGLHIEVSRTASPMVDTGHSQAERAAASEHAAVLRATAIAQLESETVVSGLQPKEQPWAGRHVLVSAGPTRAYIDPVRFISNASTGSMGFEIARAARQLGAHVTLVAGPVELLTPGGVDRIDVETGTQMLEAMDEVMRQSPVDLVAMVAAVADLVPDRPSDTKLAKVDMVDSLGRMSWRNEVDVLATLVERHGGTAHFLGFAAQTVDGEEGSEIEAALLGYGGEKLARKGTDALFVNRVGVQGTGFASSTNAGFLLVRTDDEMPAILSSGSPVPKAQLAQWILARLGERLWTGQAAVTTPREREDEVGEAAPRERGRVVV